jgi:hypothetical protein
MATAIGQVVGFYTYNPALQIAGFGRGPYPAVVVGFNTDGSVTLSLLHVAPNQIVNVWRQGASGTGPGQDYWQTTITGQQ